MGLMVLIISAALLVGLWLVDTRYRMRLPFSIWLGVIALFFFGLEQLQFLSWRASSIIWGALLVLAVAGIPVIRRPLVAGPILNWVRRILPPLTKTEQEAIDAGGVGWEGALFRGDPDWKTLLSPPQPQLSDREETFLNRQTETLCQLLNEWHITHELCDLPQIAWDYLKEEKFFAMRIPQAFGGLGFSQSAVSRIVQKIATRSISTAVTVMVPNSLGPGELLVEYGTEAQKNHYLPRLANGQDIPCFALTGPEAGSDAGAIPDRGIVCKKMVDGQEVLGIRLNWDKRYITLAPVATVMGLAFKLEDPEHLLGTEEHLGITVCLIPTNEPGIEIGHRHFPLNQAFMNGPIRGQDVFIPIDWIIGGPEMAGRGWRMLVECLSAGRGVSLPALSAAAAKLCYRSTGAYGKIRKQFNTSIGQFEGVEEAMAQIAGFSYLLEATRQLTLEQVDADIKPAVATAIAKYHMTEMARAAINHAMDVHGGRGIILGPRNYLGRLYQSIPIMITVEGANILTRNLMIFGQGAFRCHSFIPVALKAVADKDIKRGVALFDQHFFSYLRHSLTQTVALAFHGLTRGYFCRAPNVPSNQKVFYRQVSRLSLALSVVSDCALLFLGGSIKRRERLSARLGDVLSHLYMASSVLRSYHLKPANEAQEELPYFNWCLQTSIYKAQQALIGFCDNFPITWVGQAIKRLVFPWGATYSLPDDATEKLMVKIMMSPNGVRERLTKDCYITDNVQDPLSRVEQAFQRMIEVESSLAHVDKYAKSQRFPKEMPMQEKINRAQQASIISEKEAHALEQFEAARHDAIQVDDFTPDALKGT